MVMLLLEMPNTEYFFGRYTACCYKLCHWPREATFNKEATVCIMSHNDII